MKAGTYYYRVTAINDYGETAPSEPVEQQGATITWSVPEGAIGARIYRSRWVPTRFVRLHNLLLRLHLWPLARRVPGYREAFVLIKEIDIASNETTPL